jgi:hypothetical protein
MRGARGPHSPCPQPVDTSVPWHMPCAFQLRCMQSPPLLQREATAQTPGAEAQGRQRDRRPSLHCLTAPHVFEDRSTRRPATLRDGSTSTATASAPFMPDATHAAQPERAPSAPPLRHAGREAATARLSQCTAPRAHDSPPQPPSLHGHCMVIALLKQSKAWRSAHCPVQTATHTALPSPLNLGNAPGCAGKASAHHKQKRDEHSSSYRTARTASARGATLSHTSLAVWARLRLTVPICVR